LAEGFFALPCPKSLDRNAFAFVNIGLPDFSPRAWIVSGGGARNPTLMRMLAERLGPATVETADAVGWSSQSIEAQAFAYLAVRTRNGLPVTFPATTGV
jgi:anhydro-N-acetylmuramic acid kinase